jgi:hypothetical protein
MKRAAQMNTAVATCRAEYFRLQQELYRNGLDATAIQVTCDSLSLYKDGRWLLKPKAFEPTGLALGYPLPQRQQTMLLSRLTCLVDNWLQEQTESAHSLITYVPPTGYHITVLNRSHYEFSDISFLAEEEHQRIANVVEQLHLTAVGVISCGIIVTASGRLFVKCLPIDDALLAIRTKLSETIPSLRINPPYTVHIKLGHLRTMLTPEQLLAFQAWLKRADELLSTQMVFRDIYTPQGRIRLKE